MPREQSSAGPPVAGLEAPPHRASRTPRDPRSHRAPRNPRRPRSERDAVPCITDDRRSAHAWHRDCGRPQVGSALGAHGQRQPRGKLPRGPGARGCPRLGGGGEPAPRRSLGRVYLSQTAFRPIGSWRGGSGPALSGTLWAGPLKTSSAVPTRSRHPRGRLGAGLQSERSADGVPGSGSGAQAAALRPGERLARPPTGTLLAAGRTGPGSRQH